MESLDYWRLCDELTVIQAALLIAGCDPTVDANYVEQWDYDKMPVGYQAAKVAMQNAILSKSIPASIKYTAHWRGYGEEAHIGERIEIYGSKEIIVKEMPDWVTTTIQVDDLRSWLIKRGFKTGFFFPEENEATPNYLAETNPCYAPKLAAALNAWLHVTKTPELLKGKTPKQAIEKWLREHAASYGLTKEDGSPNEQGIEDIAKVANWKPTGGVAKTPNGHPATN